MVDSAAWTYIGSSWFKHCVERKKERERERENSLMCFVGHKINSGCTCIALYLQGKCTEENSIDTDM